LTLCNFCSRIGIVKNNESFDHIIQCFEEAFNRYRRGKVYDFYSAATRFVSCLGN